MLNILFIGVYKERSGWGEAARRYIRALNKTGNNIVCRPITLNNSIELDEEIKELEAKPNKNIDVVIQCCLPHMFEYSSVPNIGICFLETKDLKYTSWQSKIKMMDAMITPNSISNNINKNSFFIPVPFDDEYNITEKAEIPDAFGNYKFYFIGELNRRKNITGLIKSYYLSFMRNEPVSLILKVNKYGTTPEHVLAEVNDMVMHTAKNMKLYSRFEQYPKVITITNHISRYELLGLHNSCDCFVMPSFGEGFCLPLYDAFAMNKPIISNVKIEDTLKYVKYDSVSYTKSEEQNVFAMTETFKDVFTSREKWSEPSIKSLSSLMKYYYNKKLKVENKEEELRKSYINRYSLRVVGECFDYTIKRILHETIFKKCN